MATTKPKSKAQTQSNTTRQGRISEVIGAVVDVEFEPGYQPELFEALEVKTQQGRTVVLEVESDRGDNTVRCIAMDSTDGFRRGDPVTATGAPISVPVGVETLGRLFTSSATRSTTSPPRKGPRAGRSIVPRRRVLSS